MNPINQPLLDAVCRRGVLVATSVRYWRGCKKLAAEDLGLDPDRVSDRLIQLGHKRLIPREALAKFSLIESRAHALVESSSFPFLGGIARFVPNPRLADVVEKLANLRQEFIAETEDFVSGYTMLRGKALAEWRTAAAHLGEGQERLLNTIEQSFPPATGIGSRFVFESRLFQVAAPEGIRLEILEGVEQLEIAEERQRIVDDASQRLQGDLDSFIRESVATLRQETARLASDVLATINGSENGVHQRTLNRLASFIENFRSLNFAGDEPLEAMLERFRRDLLTRSAEDYRNNGTAMTDLTTGLAKLQDSALQLARGDTREIVSRFGQMGTRRLAAAG